LVVIYDQSGTHRAKEVTIDDQDVKDGYMVTYNIVAAAQESVVVQIISEAGETYAAGFFMKSSTTNIAPEPATLTFLAIGAAALVLRRRRT
jgi:purine nucleoside permease